MNTEQHNINRRRQRLLAGWLLYVLAVIGGAILFLAAGCQSILDLAGTLPDYLPDIVEAVPGVELPVPAWDKATLASCWQGSNAEVRHMNNLSPAIPEAEFEARIDWALSIGCNTVHLFIGNQGDGERAGYCIYGNSWDWTINDDYCDLFRERIAYARSKGLVVVIWLRADDSKSWNEKMAKDPDRYLRGLDAEGLLDYASIVVLGLELTEDYNEDQVARLAAATRKVYPGKIGTHEESYKTEFAKYGDIVFYQVKPGKSAAWIKTEAARIKAATGKPVNFFELSRSPDRTLSQAALDGGAFAVGNWNKE